MFPKKGKISEYTEGFQTGQGTVLLDDGTRVVFFRYSCSFGPVQGMTVYVWATEHHAGGLRATALTATATRPPDAGARAARAEDRAAAILKKVEEDRRVKQEVDAGRARLAQFRAAFTDEHAAPRPLDHATYLGAPLPAEVQGLARRAVDSFGVAIDPALVPLSLEHGALLALVAHPDLPAELVCVDYGTDEWTGTLPLKDAPALVEKLAAADDDDEAFDFAVHFRKRKRRARADAKGVEGWLNAGEDKQAALGAVLLDLYEERGWGPIAARLTWQVKRRTHLEQVRLASVAFVEQARGAEITPRAAAALLAELTSSSQLG